jgi:D-proline reductase (dithiol) PrdB
MTDAQKKVDGFRFMPPSLAAWIKIGIPAREFQGAIAWTALKKPLASTTLAIMTSAGISMRGDQPFDMERERREPTWGDPGYREIPRQATENDVAVNHLHINTDYIKADLNVILPIQRFAEFEAEAVIGRLAPTSYSYYGYQPDPTVLLQETMPKVAARMHAEGVEAVLLTPA